MTSYFLVKAISSKKLSDKDLFEINNIITIYNNKPEIAELVNKGHGELFVLSKFNAPEKILLEVKILLPVLLFEDAIDDFIYVVENWMCLASAIRNNINNDTQWMVNIDESIVRWNKEEKKYTHPSP